MKRSVNYFENFEAGHHLLKIGCSEFSFTKHWGYQCNLSTKINKWNGIDNRKVVGWNENELNIYFSFVLMFEMNGMESSCVCLGVEWKEIEINHFITLLLYHFFFF